MMETQIKTFGELSEAEQADMRAKHEQGYTIELYNPNTCEWYWTRTPMFSSCLAYRIAR
jgi:hypothetical protein